MIVCKFRNALLFFLMVFLLLSCNDSSKQEIVKLQVATSIFPICDITQNIAGQAADVFFVIPIHANPHTYQPVPSLVNQLKNSDLFIGVHRELDGWIEDFLTGSTIVVYLNEEMEQDTSHYQDSSLQRHDNPHLWLTVKGAEACTQMIAEALASQDTVNRSIYLEQSQDYLQELDLLNQRIFRLFENIQTKKMIQWHPAWDYFAADYGLEIVGTIEQGHGDEPSLKAFQELIEIAKRQNVKTVVIGLTAQSNTVEALVREINGSLIRLDSIGDPDDPERSSYIKLMEYNATLLVESFNP